MRLGPKEPQGGFEGRRVIDVSGLDLVGRQFQEAIRMLLRHPCELGARVAEGLFLYVVHEDLERLTLGVTGCCVADDRNGNK